MSDRLCSQTSAFLTRRNVTSQNLNSKTDREICAVGLPRGPGDRRAGSRRLVFRPSQDLSDSRVSSGTGRSASGAEGPESRNPGFLTIGKSVADGREHAVHRLPGDRLAQAGSGYQPIGHLCPVHPFSSPAILSCSPITHRARRRSTVASQKDRASRAFPDSVPAFAPASHSSSFDQRRRPDALRAGMATAFFWPTSTTSR